MKWDDTLASRGVVEGVWSTPVPVCVLLPLESRSLYSPRDASRKCTPLSLVWTLICGD